MYQNQIALNNDKEKAPKEKNEHYIHGNRNKTDSRFLIRSNASKTTVDQQV